MKATIKLITALLLTPVLMGQNFHDVDLTDHEYLTPVILNGEVVRANASPHAFMTRLELQSPSGTKSCSAVILSRDTLVTAAHCLHGIRSGRIHFANGTRRISAFVPMQKFVDMFEAMPPSTRVSTQKVDQERFERFMEEINSRSRPTRVYGSESNNFSEMYSYDVGLVFFDGGLPRGHHFAKWYAGPIPDFQTIYHFGYGLHSHSAPHSDRRLRRGEGRIISVLIEGEHIRQFATATGHKERGNPCFGDSGGGTFIYNEEAGEYQFLGIIAAVQNFCANEAYSVPMSQHSDWLLDLVERYRRSRFL